jgi:hypothetical protein
VKISVDRIDIVRAWEAMCRVSTLAVTSPREACELHEATGILSEILRANPEQPDLPYIAPELAIKHIEQEWENREAIIEILDMLAEFAYSKCLHSKVTLGDRAADLASKLGREK